MWQPNADLKRLDEVKSYLAKRGSLPDLKAKRLFFPQEIDEDIDVDCGNPTSNDISREKAVEMLESGDFTPGLQEAILNNMGHVDKISVGSVKKLVKSHASSLSEEFLRLVVLPKLAGEEDGEDVCRPFLEVFADMLVPSFVVPRFLSTGSVAFLSQIKPSRSAVFLENLAAVKADVQIDLPKLIQMLQPVDIADPAVQNAIGRVLARYGCNEAVAKSTKFGKTLLGLIKDLPAAASAETLNIFAQAVSKHKSFLAKACEAELKKRSL